MMIRKSGLFLLVVVPLVALVWLYLARNLLVAGVARLALEAMLGTEVRIEDVDVQPFEMRATFGRLRIADREQAGQAMLVAGPARFDMNGLQLFARKLVVDEMRVDGLALGVPCADCRPPPPAPAPPPAAAPGEEEGPGWLASIPLPELNLDALQQEVDVGRVTEGQRLASVQRTEQAEADGKARTAALQQRERQLGASARLQAIRQRVAALDFSSKDPRQLQAALAALKQANAEVKALREEVQALSRDVQAEPGRVQADFSAAETGLKEDVAAAMRVARLGDLDVGQVGELVFGTVVMERFTWVLEQVRMARGMLGARPDEQPAPPRRAGRLIAYPVTGRAYPRFLVETIAFTGTGQDARGTDVSYTGRLTGVTSNARVYGQPMKLDATASAPGGERWVVTGVFDHRESPGEDRLTARGSGVRISDVKLSGGSLPERASSRSADVTLQAVLRGGALEASMRVDAKGVQFHFPAGTTGGSADGATRQAVRDLFADFDQVRVEALLSGTLRKPRVRISSSIDEQFSRRMRGLVGQRRAAAEARIRAQLAQRLAERQAQVRQTLEAPRAELQVRVQRTDDQVRAYQEELARRQAELEAALRQQATGGAQQKAEDLKSRLRKR